MEKNKWLTDYHRLILAMITNGLLVVMEIWGLVLSIISQGLELFEFYTVDSNILCLIASIFFLVFGSIALKKKTYALPKYVTMLRLSASTALALTFIVVVAILCPVQGGGEAYIHMLFTEEMLFQHFLCPILSVLSFLFLEKDVRLILKDTVAPLFFTLVYAIPIIIMNFTRTIEGPYPFLMVYEQEWYMTIIYFLGIFGGDYLLSFVLYLPSLHDKKLLSK